MKVKAREFFGTSLEHRPESQDGNQPIRYAPDTHRKPVGFIPESRFVKYSSAEHLWEAASVLLWKEVDWDSGDMYWNPVLVLC